MGRAVKELFQYWSANMDDVLTVRNMLATDVELVFQWRNDPRVRKYMFDAAPLEPKGHLGAHHLVLNDNKIIITLFLKFGKGPLFSLLADG